MCAPPRSNLGLVDVVEIRVKARNLYLIDQDEAASRQYMGGERTT